MGGLKQSREIPIPVPPQPEKTGGTRFVHTPRRAVAAEYWRYFPAPGSRHPRHRQEVIPSEEGGKTGGTLSPNIPSSSKRKSSRALTFKRFLGGFSRYSSGYETGDGSPRKPDQILTFWAPLAAGLPEPQRALQRVLLSFFLRGVSLAGETGVSAVCACFWN